MAYIPSDPFNQLAFYCFRISTDGIKVCCKKLTSHFKLIALLSIQPYPDVTPDKLLTAIFGGFFLGIGIGLAIRAEAVLDGTEIAALLISKNSSLKVADVILLLNILIFSAALFFLGVEPASYSILTYFAASKTIDFLLHGLEEYTGVTIVSKKSEEIRHAITNDLDSGVNVYSGKRGHGKQGSYQHEMDIIFTVVTRLEIGRSKPIVKNLDVNAFMIQHSIKICREVWLKNDPYIKQKLLNSICFRTFYLLYYIFVIFNIRIVDLIPENEA